MRDFAYMTLTVVAAMSLALFVITIPVTAASPLYELSATGTGLVKCSNGDSFTGNIEINAIENPDGTVSGIIVVTDPVEGTITNANIDGGKINKNHFKLVSNDVSSVEIVPFCHAGDDPDMIVVKGHGGDDVGIKFESICEGAGGDDIECVNGKGLFEGDVEISPVP